MSEQKKEMELAWIPLAKQDGFFAELWKEGSKLEDFDIVARFRWALENGVVGYVPKTDDKNLLLEAPLSGNVGDMYNYYKGYADQNITPIGLEENTPTGVLGVTFKGFGDKPLPNNVRLIFLYPTEFQVKGVTTMMKKMVDLDKEDKQRYLNCFHLIAVVETDLEPVHLDMVTE